MKACTSAPPATSVSEFIAKRKQKGDHHTNHGADRDSANGSDGAVVSNIAFLFRSPQVWSSQTDIGKHDESSTPQQLSAVADDSAATLASFGSLFDKFEQRFNEQSYDAKAPVAQAENSVRVEKIETVLPDASALSKSSLTVREAEHLQFEKVVSKAKSHGVLPNLRSSHEFSSFVLKIAIATQEAERQTTEQAIVPHADVITNIMFAPRSIGAETGTTSGPSTGPKPVSKNYIKLKIHTADEGPAEAKADSGGIRNSRQQATNMESSPHSPSGILFATVSQPTIQDAVPTPSEQIYTALSQSVAKPSLYNAPSNAMKTLLIRLQPEGLGQLEIALKSKNGILKVHLTAAHDDALRAIQKDSDELKKSLSAISSSIDHVDLSFSVAGENIRSEQTIEQTEASSTAGNYSNADTGSSSDEKGSANYTKRSEKSTFAESLSPSVKASQGDGGSGSLGDSSSIYL